MSNCAAPPLTGGYTLSESTALAPHSPTPTPSTVARRPSHPSSLKNSIDDYWHPTCRGEQLRSVGSDCCEREPPGLTLTLTGPAPSHPHTLRTHLFLRGASSSSHLRPGSVCQNYRVHPTQLNRRLASTMMQPLKEHTFPTPPCMHRLYTLFHSFGLAPRICLTFRLSVCRCSGYCRTPSIREVSARAVSSAVHPANLTRTSYYTVM